MNFTAFKFNAALRAVHQHQVLSFRAYTHIQRGSVAIAQCVAEYAADFLKEEVSEGLQITRTAGEIAFRHTVCLRLIADTCLLYLKIDAAAVNAVFTRQSI